MYLNKDDLYYETMISIGKGYKTEKLKHYFYLIAQGMTDKFRNKSLNYDWNISEDQLHEAYLALSDRWHTVNPQKYPNVFAFYSEIAKRACSQSFNQIVLHIKPGRKHDPVQTISLTNFY